MCAFGGGKSHKHKSLAMGLPCVTSGNTHQSLPVRRQGRDESWWACEREVSEGILCFLKHGCSWIGCASCDFQACRVNTYSRGSQGFYQPCSLRVTLTCTANSEKDNILLQNITKTLVSQFHILPTSEWLEWVMMGAEIPASSLTSTPWPEYFIAVASHSDTE